MPQLRRNPITGEWVVIAPERAKRPDDYIRAETAKPQSKVTCPFCPTGKMYKEYQDRIKDFEDDYIYVTWHNSTDGLKQSYKTNFLTTKNHKLN